MQEVGGVRGHYLPHAMLLPQEHAIALTIGRIIIWGTVNAIPQRTLDGADGTNFIDQCQLGREVSWSMVCIHFLGHGNSHV